MSEAVIVALITGGLTLAGSIITVLASQRKTENTLKTEVAVIRTDVSGLRKEVEKHNNFAVKIPALEAKVDANKTAINRLENFHME